MYGKRVLVTGKPIRHLRKIQLHIQGAFGGGCDSELLARHDNPLPHDPVAGYVLLKRVSVIGLSVSLYEVTRRFLVFQSCAGKHSGPRRIHPWSKNVASVNKVCVGEDIDGTALQIAS